RHGRRVMKGDAERWIGIRWEFMREDPKYIEAFDRLIKIESNNTDRGILFAESKKVFQELGLNFPWNPHHIPSLLNPNKSFDELNPFEVDFLLHAFKSKAVTINPYFINDENKRTINYDGLMIALDFNEINSIEALKQVVSAAIKLAWENYEVPFRFGYRKKKKTNWTDFEKILKVGRLKKENPEATYKELAEIVFPKEMNPEAVNVSPESAIKKTTQLHMRYKELTEKGGWRKNLRFP
ncbi:MAG: hypothetical protein NTY64_04835, partial [Deltaproteobacteria bacterium]|nr:hypothetical protein [Deltaproteobacteria bacterium]